MNKLPNDAIMLVSVLNTKLRDFYPSFSALCEDLDVDGEAILQKLSAIDYHYDENRNQFV